MKKVMSVGFLFGLAVLLLLLVVGAAAAAPPLQDIGDPDLPRDPELDDPELDDPEPEIEEVEAAEPAEAAPEGTAVRVDFELAPGHSAKRGHYSIQTLGGGEIASWYALDGWLDSGWISNVDIGNRTVWVEVVYYPGPETEGTVMRILNHVPDEPYGWVASGEAHALEVAWPDMPVEGVDDVEVK